MQMLSWLGSSEIGDLEPFLPRACQWYFCSWGDFYINARDVRLRLPLPSGWVEWEWARTSWGKSVHLSPRANRMRALVSAFLIIFWGWRLSPNFPSSQTQLFKLALLVSKWKYPVYSAASLIWQDQNVDFLIDFDLFAFQPHSHIICS